MESRICPTDAGAQTAPVWRARWSTCVSLGQQYGGWISCVRSLLTKQPLRCSGGETTHGRLTVRVEALEHLLYHPSALLVQLNFSKNIEITLTLTHTHTHTREAVRSQLWNKPSKASGPHLLIFTFTSCFPSLVFLRLLNKLAQGVPTAGINYVCRVEVFFIYLIFFFASLKSSNAVLAGLKVRLFLVFR